MVESEKREGVGLCFVLNNPAPASASCLPSAAQSSATGRCPMPTVPSALCSCQLGEGGLDA